MDPNYHERRLIDEVIYLHSLWHQGPPRPVQPRPAPAPAPSNYFSPAQLLHYTSTPTHFKREGIRGKHRRRNERQSGEGGKERPCNPSSGAPPATTSEWNKSWPKPNSETLLPTPEQEAKLAANQAQSKALKVTKDYFKSNAASDVDESDDDDFMEEDDGGEEYRFFVKLFMEDDGLTEYYNKNYRNGEFSCLVCGGLGRKLAGKKFKGCIALVQHSISIARTKKRRAHKAYGQAVCKILGWDINNLARIASSMAENHVEPNPPESTGRGDVLALEEAEGVSQANVVQGDKDGLAALESKDGSADASNSGEGEANVSEGGLNPLSSLVSKDGTANVKNAGEGEAQAVSDEGTKDSSTTLEEFTVHVDIAGQVEIERNKEGEEQIEESSAYQHLENDSESAHFSQNSQTAAAASKSADDFSVSVFNVDEGKETEMLNDEEPPKDG